jgi:4-alpha-glucanotransferase
MNFDTHRAGLLLHPTSLPSGTLADAGRWLDFLHAAGFGVWQMLPLGIPLTGLSPYQCASAFAIDPALFPQAPVALDGFAAWRAKQQHWLEDFARFTVIKAEQGGAPWTDWPVALRDRDAQALAAFDAAHADKLQAVRVAQYGAALHWQEIRAAAAARGVKLFGDMPIFVAQHSADVWARRDLFLLDAAGHPTVVAGVPPDYFSATGQRWGNPLYRWDAHARDGYAWWVQRMRQVFELVDVVRIDHFRGFAGCWEIPADEPTAVHGHWRRGPGIELFKAVNAALGPLPIIAEDLGVITPDVDALRRRLQVPGMRVLQFAFGGDASNTFLPHHHECDTVAYPGTHDNDTCLGWWASASEHERHFARGYLGTDGHDIAWSLIRACCASVADTAIYAMQDVLSLPGECRMNFPGQSEGWWQWRLQWSQVQPWHAQRLAELCRLYDRLPRPQREAA